MTRSIRRAALDTQLRYVWMQMATVAAAAALTTDQTATESIQGRHADRQTDSQVWSRSPINYQPSRPETVFIHGVQKENCYFRLAPRSTTLNDLELL